MGQKKELQMLLAACVFVALSASFGIWFNDAINNTASWMWLGTLGAGFSVSILAAVVCLDIWRLKPADSHTLGSLLSQYIYLLKLKIRAPFLKSYIDQVSKNPLKANTKTLLRIIRKNQNTQYGNKYKFSEIHSLEDYVKMHPVTSYEHFRSYVERALAGEYNVLFPGKGYFFASTSGTTSAAKVYPLGKSFLQHYRHGAENIVRTYNLLDMINMKRFFRFHIFSKAKLSSGGIPVGAASQRVLSFPYHNLMPIEYQKLVQEDQSYYAMAVFALAERELSHIDIFSADLMNAFMKFTVKNWENICQDIETGRIGVAVEMPEEIREALSSHLQADQERAEFLRVALKHGIVGLAKRAWPDLAFITMARSAGFKVLATKLMDNHFKGVKVIGFIHGATEGLTGLNLEEKNEVGDKKEIFTIYPELCFVEFIPLENVDDEHPEPIQINQLKTGHCYEIVHTNENGLYRCRYGDVIKIVDLRNNLPKYEFLYRLGQRLNIAYERTPENFLCEALVRSASHIGCTMVDFTTTESTTIEEIAGEGESKGHYVFFIEFAEEVESISALAQKVDETLQEIYELYKRYRDIGSIGDVEVIQVKSGAMDGMKQLIMGVRVNPQFKMPRVTRNEPAIRHLLNNRKAD